MIIVDFSVLLYKNLFSAIKNSTDENNKPIKKHPTEDNKLYKTSEYKRLWKHKMINDLRYIYKENKHKYGDMVLAIDNYTCSNWKKEFYPRYKANRKKGRDNSGVNFPEFFEEVSILTQELKDYFPFKIVNVDQAEGDDVIGVLATKFQAIEDVLIITTDKDMNQLFKYKNIKIFNPLKLKMTPRMNEQQLQEWLVEHIMLGDTADNVSKVVAETEFSDEFITFLQSKDVYENRVHEFNQLSISKKLTLSF